MAVCQRHRLETAALIEGRDPQTITITASTAETLEAKAARLQSSPPLKVGQDGNKRPKLGGGASSSWWMLVGVGLFPPRRRGGLITLRSQVAPGRPLALAGEAPFSRGGAGSEEQRAR